MHSIKPDDQYKLIEAYYPKLLKIEINPRRARLGWDCWDAKAEAPLVAPSSELPASELAPPTGPVAVATLGNHPLDIPPLLRRGGGNTAPLDERGDSICGAARAR